MSPPASCRPVEEHLFFAEAVGLKYHREPIHLLLSCGNSHSAQSQPLAVKAIFGSRWPLPSSCLHPAREGHENAGLPLLGGISGGPPALTEAPEPPQGDREAMGTALSPGCCPEGDIPRACGASCTFCEGACLLLQHLWENLSVFRTFWGHPTEAAPQRADLVLHPCHCPCVVTLCCVPIPVTIHVPVTIRVPIPICVLICVPIPVHVPVLTPPLPIPTPPPFCALTPPPNGRAPPGGEGAWPGGRGRGSRGGGRG